MQIIWSHTETLPANAGKHYRNHHFEVPEGMRHLRLTMTFNKQGASQLYPSLFAPDGYRGTRMKPSAVGQVVLELDTAERYAGPGALPGPITPGRWRVLIDVQWLDEPLSYTLTVAASAQPPEPMQYAAPDDNGRDGAGYYRGELHAHSHHSDGLMSVAEVVAAARKYRLDYFALTDHFTAAGWQELESLAGSDLAVMKGIEFTGHWGHGNLHGLSRWIDTFIDDCTARTINDVIEEAHAQGGLFSVNHAFSLNLGWRYHELDWGLVDLVEIYHHLTASNNIPQLGLWDQLLNQGYKITGVGAIDSHHPHLGQHRLGQVFTYVNAAALRPESIIEGLRSGDVYVSLGPTLTFEAASRGHSARMGETLEATGSVTLNVKLEQLEYPSRLLVMKNGLHHDNITIPAGKPFELELRDPRPTRGYYRLELYTRARDSSFEAVREWDKTLLLSNPIFVR